MCRISKQYLGESATAQNAQCVNIKTFKISGSSCPLQIAEKEQTELRKRKEKTGIRIEINKRENIKAVEKNQRNQKVVLQKDQ